MSWYLTIVHKLNHYTLSEKPSLLELNRMFIVSRTLEMLFFLVGGQFLHFRFYIVQCIFPVLIFNHRKSSIESIGFFLFHVLTFAAPVFAVRSSFIGSAMNVQCLSYSCFSSGTIECIRPVPRNFLLCMIAIDQEACVSTSRSRVFERNVLVLHTQ